jgi:hypothetical protein
MALKGARRPVHALKCERQLWVDLTPSPVGIRAAGIGASCTLPRVPAKVASLNPQRPFGLGGGNRSSCPITAMPKANRRASVRWEAAIVSPVIGRPRCAQFRTFTANEVAGRRRSRLRIARQGTPWADPPMIWAGKAGIGGEMRHLADYSPAVCPPKSMRHARTSKRTSPLCQGHQVITARPRPTSASHSTKRSRVREVDIFALAPSRTAAC